MKTYDSLRTELLTEEYLPLCEELRHYLEEKLLVIGKGAKYGQAVILAGGAGSGKSFAAANLMQGDMFKIYNPDDIKSALLKMRDNVNNAATDALTHPLPPLSEPMKKNIEKIQGLNMLDPRDTGTLHKLIKNMKKDAVGKEWDKDANKFVNRVHKDMSIDQRRMMYAFFGERGRTELPNVMFDITLKDIGALHNDLSGELGVLDFLKGAGYKPENIHIVWILTDYRIAMQQNLTRDRVVAADILFQTHRGASATMQDILFRNYGSLGINGEITVVMGGKNGGNVEYKKGMTYEKDGKSYVIDRDVNVPVFKEIKYYRVKLAGQRGINSEALKAIMNEIKKKAPGARATPEKTLSQAIKKIGARKRGGKIDPVTANALDIPLSNPAVRKRK